MKNGIDADDVMKGNMIKVIVLIKMSPMTDSQNHSEKS